MSKIEFSVDLNGKLVPGELQATLFHQLHRQVMAQCTTIIEGIDTIGYLAPFAMIQAYYASRGEAVPPAMQPRVEVLAQPADEDNDIEEILLDQYILLSISPISLLLKMQKYNVVVILKK